MTTMVKFPINPTKIGRRGIMHVRVATGQITSGKMQEAINIYNNSISEVKAQKEYQGGYLMTDAGSGKILSFTLWDSKSDMLSGESSGVYYQLQVGKYPFVFAGTPTGEHYELVSENSP